MKRYIILILSAFTFLSCINNDLPYPVILGGVELIEFEGQSEVKIDAQKRVIQVTLDDTVDIRAIKILQLDITADSKCSIDSGGIIDLSDGVSYVIGKPYKFTITTFQDYEWSIEATQPLDRAITLSGSIGDALFDLNNKTAVVKVGQTQDLYDIKVETFKLAPSIAVYTPDPMTISDFSEEVHFEVSYFGITEQWIVNVQFSFENVVTGVPDAWSSFAYLYGDILPTSSETPGFEYKEASSDDWISIGAQSKSGKIEAVAKDLKPNTKYVFKAFLGGEYGAEVEFTTDNQPSVPNLNFESGYYDGANWYPNASGGNSYWATGNEGITAAPVTKPPNTTPTDDAVSGKAVKMFTYTEILVVQVAAGNLFTGTYKTNMADPIQSAKNGRPYSGRPLGLKGWFKYSPQIINGQRNGSAGDQFGKMDKCHIYMVLEDWGDAITRPADPTQIAYGEFKTDSKIDEYTQFEFRLEYQSNKKPTHISIVATSSHLGAVFAGGANSTLYIDEFELLFDYVEPAQP